MQREYYNFRSASNEQPHPVVIFLVLVVEHCGLGGQHDLLHSTPLVVDVPTLQDHPVQELCAQGVSSGCGESQNLHCSYNWRSISSKAIQVCTYKFYTYKYF